MNAHQLLQNIEAHGGVVTVKRDGGAAKLNVSPRAVALELASDIQRFKPALLELLSPLDAQPDDDAARERFPAHLRAHFSDADRVAIGRNLLALDRGEEIE